MNYETEIEKLKVKVEAVEDTLMLIYDSLNKRIGDLQNKRNRNLTLWGIVIAVILGSIQIAIAVYSKAH